ncbi:MAG: hypothetical protein LC808_35010 [Actinobacteria bacterium]|nr:hypothetical protein [Actinomycetota bacterium]
MNDRDEFKHLQQRLADLWPTMSPRSSDPEPRTVVVIHSISFSVPEHTYPLHPAMEERFLFYVLNALRQRSTRVVYVTSQPVHPRLVDYFLDLVPGVDLDDVRKRLIFISLSDPSPKPLTEKILSRPPVVERIRREVARTEQAIIVPYYVSALELELAVQLGVPLYGPDPALEHWGTKIGSRTIFTEEGVSHPIGVEDVSTINDLASGIEHIRKQRPGVRRVVVKLDRALNGLGNAIIDLEGATDRDEVVAAARNLAPEDRQSDAATYLGELRTGGGIVEELITGDEFGSPSVQLRNSPLGEVEIISTHDQVLGGPTGQMFLGCRFPADPAYVRAISEEAMKVGKRLASEGVIGRYGIDFVVTRNGAGSWLPYAVEINLRNGGTTHPFLTVIALTDGVYDPASGIFTAPDGTERHYMATDHLEDESLKRLTPDDLLDLAAEAPLAWDREALAGPVFHLVSAIAVSGQIGVTAIEGSREEAHEMYSTVRQRLIEEATKAQRRIRSA